MPTGRTEPAKSNPRLPNDPPHRIASKDKPAADHPIRLASTQPASEPGVVIDWTSVVSTNNMRFRGDTTYYVSGAVSVEKVGSNIDIRHGSGSPWKTKYQLSYVNV